MAAYIGITGIRRIEDITAIQELIRRKTVLLNGHIIGFGFVHHLLGKAGLPLQELKQLSYGAERSCPGSFSIIHVNGWDHSARSQRRLHALAGCLPLSAGIQINRFSWPLNIADRLRATVQGHRLILPFNPARISLQKCTAFLHKFGYDDQITLLLDSSEGKGVPINALTAAHVVNTLKAAFPHLAFSLAGGLGSKISPATAGILAALRPISTDAETGLMFRHGPNIKNVIKYLNRISAILDSARCPFNAEQALKQEVDLITQRGT